MTSEQPLASEREWREVCDLSPEALRERIAAVRAEVLPHVASSGKLADGFAWEFEADPEMRAKLEQLVAFERQCCGGLSWQLGLTAASKRLRLTVTGIDPDSKLLEHMSGPSESPGRGGRLVGLAKAGGFGFAISFFVFCVLPMGVAAFGGAAVAASFAKLDDPLLVAAGTVVLGVVAWLAMRRRGARTPA